MNRMASTDCGMRIADCGIQGKQILQSSILNPQSSILNPRSSILNPQSALCGRSPRCAGFTLLELLVVAMLTILLSMIIGQAWRHLSVGMADSVARTRCAQELRLGLSSLARDLGVTVGATPLEAGRILLCLDGGDEPNGLADWAEPDQTVEYVLRGGQLLRRQTQDGREFVAAGDVTDFSIRSIGGQTIELTLRVQRGTVHRQASLTWSPP